MIKNLISIIVPVYNSEKYIRKCIEALLNQTYKNIEIICINDGSTDSSREILEEYASKDYRIKLINNKNSGPATSRNIGLDNATGEYIMFCDSDDSYEPQMCEKMLKAISTHNVDLVTCRANSEFEVGINRKVVANAITNSIPVGRIVVNYDKPTMLSVLLWHKIFKKSLIDKYGIRFPDGLESDDNLFCYEYYVLVKETYGLKEKLYNYLVRENSIMDKYDNRKDLSKLYDRVKIFEHFYKYLKHNNFEKEFKMYYFKLFVEQIKICFKILKTEEEKRECIRIVDLILKKTEYQISKNSLFYWIQKGNLKKVDKLINKQSLYQLVTGKSFIMLVFKNLPKMYSKYLQFYC